MITVCFTGHRPEKLGGYDWNDKLNIKIRDNIKEVLEALLKHYPNEQFHFIFGGALGFDQFATQVVLELKNKYKDRKIALEIAVPFKNQPNKWFNKSDIERYYNQLKFADKVTYVDRLPDYGVKGFKEDEYSVLKLNIRNNYMVDNSDIVIAYWDGSKSGTGNCVNYAEKKNKKIINIYNYNNKGK